MALAATRLAEARVLRDRGVSLRTIAAMTGIPRSTLGGHLRGYGETVAEIKCERCGAVTIAFSARKRWCSERCAGAAWAEANREHRRTYKREWARLDREIRHLGRST